MKTEIRNADNILCVERDIHAPTLDADGHIDCDHDVIMSLKEEFLPINNQSYVDFQATILKHGQKNDNVYHDCNVFLLLMSPDILGQDIVVICDGSKINESVM